MADTVLEPTFETRQEELTIWFLGKQDMLI